MTETLTSAELNERLAEISDEPDKHGFEAFGGKAIPYIGWFWREVDFDETEGHLFGVIPSGTRDIGGDLADYLTAMGKNPARPTSSVGFMENNKWGYPYVRADAREWAEIKRLLIEVATNPNADTLRAANEKIQALVLKPRIEEE